MQAGHIIFDIHFHTAQGVVDRAHGAVVDHIIAVDIQTVQKALNSLNGVQGIVLLGFTKAVGQTQLFFSCTYLVTENTEDIDIDHCITVELKLVNLFIRVVKGNEHQEVSLSAVTVYIEFICGLVVFAFIDTGEQQCSNSRLFPVLDSVQSHNLQLSEVFAHLGGLVGIPFIIMCSEKHDSNHERNRKDYSYNSPYICMSSHNSNPLPSG